MYQSTIDSVALIKLETLYGQDAAPAAADVMLLMDIQVNTVADKLERKVAKPYFGSNPFVLVGKKVTLDAKCDLLGNLTPGLAAPLGPIYRITGHKEVLVAGPPAKTQYKPITRNVESASIYFFWAGILFKLTGARGSLDFEYAIKNYALGTLKVTGLLTIPEDGDVPAGIDWSQFQTPVAIETATWDVTVKDGANPAVVVNANQLTITSGSKVDLVEGSARREVAFKDRQTTGTLKVFKDDTLAAWNPWAIAEAHKIVTLSNTITGQAGLNVDHQLRVQFEYPKPASIEDLAGFEIPFVAIPTGAGGDEYGITLT